MHRHTLALLLGGVVEALSIVGDPTQLNVTQTTMRNFSAFEAQFFPDGKMVVFEEFPDDPETDFIINITPNYRMSSPNVLIEDTDRDLSVNASDYPDALPMDGGNFATLPPTLPIPGPNVTGMRGNGSLYDTNSVWIFNMFRLSNTSQPDAANESLIGFEHNEDHYEGSISDGQCVYKSIAVRYSEDLGASWTRSVPIITTGIQQEPGECDPFTGAADFVTMWDPVQSRWVIYFPDYSLVMAVSTDPLARPGTWERFNPVDNTTAPGFIGDNTTFAHPDLVNYGGGNPSIIWDESRSLYHMAWTLWGGGLVATSSPDLDRWDEPVIVFNGTEDIGAPSYPTLVGDKGDLLSTDGNISMYFTANTTVSFGRAVWVVPMDFD